MHGSSIIDRDSKHENISHSRFYKEDNTVLDSFSQESNYKVLQSSDYSIQNLNQSKQLPTNYQVRKSSFINTPLLTHFIESNTTINDITDSINKHKINLKSNTSKSLHNSPTETNVFSLGSRIMQKDIRKTIAKYVPNSVFNFGFNNIKSQSNSDINSFSSFDMSSVEKYQSLDDIVGDKTDTVEFDKQDVDLTGNRKLFTLKETHDNGLKLYCAQLNNTTGINFRSNSNVLPENKLFRSNSTQFLSSSDSTSPTTVKEIASLSNENVLNKKFAGDCYQSSIVKKLAKETANVNELPLLSLFEKSDSLAGSRSKSISMINLGDKRNFMSLDDLRINSKKTVSTGKLTNIQNNLVLRTAR